VPGLFHLASIRPGCPRGDHVDHPSRSRVLRFRFFSRASRVRRSLVTAMARAIRLPQVPRLPRGRLPRPPLPRCMSVPTHQPAVQERHHDLAGESECGGEHLGLSVLLGEEPAALGGPSFQLGSDGKVEGLVSRDCWSPPPWRLQPPGSVDRTGHRCLEDLQPTLRAKSLVPRLQCRQAACSHLSAR
jgi:hypothetical protein